MLLAPDQDQNTEVRAGWERWKPETLFCFLELVVKKFYYFCSIFIAAKIGLACCGLASFCVLFLFNLAGIFFVFVADRVWDVATSKNRLNITILHASKMLWQAKRDAYWLRFWNEVCGLLIWVTYFQVSWLIFSKSGAENIEIKLVVLSVKFIVPILR